MMNFLSEIKFEIKSIKTDRKQLVKFGLVVGAIFVLLGFFYGMTLWIIGGALIIFGILLPNLLRYPYLAWMSFAVIIGFFIFRMILVILFYLAILPMGIVARLFGRDELGFRKRRESYWVPHAQSGTPNDPY